MRQPRLLAVNNVALRSVQFSTRRMRVRCFNFTSHKADVRHTMGVLPSTQPVATFGSSFILLSVDLACTCWFGGQKTTYFK